MTAVIKAVAFAAFAAAAALTASYYPAAAAAAAPSGTITHNTGVFTERQSHTGIGISHTAAEKTVTQTAAGCTHHLPGTAAGRTKTSFAFCAVAQTVAF